MDELHKRLNFNVDGETHDRFKAECTKHVDMTTVLKKFISLFLFNEKFKKYFLSLKIRSKKNV